MSEELKPCPFCGGKAHYNRKQMPQGCVLVGYDCEQCGAAAPVFTGPEAIEKSMKIQAAEAWDRRDQQPNEPLMVTFPCKMGDTVYEVEDGLPIISYRVTGFVLGKTEFEDEDDIEARLGWQVEYGKYGVDCECPISEFGKSLFLTHEAAEQALAYRRPLEAGEKG